MLLRTQIKPTNYLGTNHSWAYAGSSTFQLTGRRPEACQYTIWEVLEKDTTFRSQDSISIMTVEQWREEDEITREKWAAGEALDVRGAIGPFASSVNGVYDQSDVFVKGYQKRMHPECVLEHSRARRLWQFKSPLGCFSYIPEVSRALPNEITGTPWNVLLNGAWDPQPDMTVMTLSRRKQLDSDVFGGKFSDASNFVATFTP